MRCAHGDPAGTRVVSLASNRVLGIEDTLVEFKYPAKSDPDIAAMDWYRSDSFNDWTKPALRDISRQHVALEEEAMRDQRRKTELEKALKKLRDEIVAAHKSNDQSDRNVDLFVFMHSQARSEDYIRTINDAMGRRHRAQGEEASEMFEKEQLVGKLLEFR